VKFRKQGPKFLEDMHIIFGKAHVSGSSATCPRDISSDEASDEDSRRYQNVQRRYQNVQRMLGRQGIKERRNARGPPLLLKTRMRRAHFFACIRTLV